MVVVGISSRNVIRGKGKTQMYRLYNIDKKLAMNKIMWVVRVSQIISGIEVTSYNKNVIDVCFSILEIL